LVFAAAPGKGDHTAILDCMTRTLESTKNELRTVVGQRIPAMIANRPCYLSADQPERRELVGLLRGNSNLHALFGLSCGFLRLDKPFVACLNCTTINRVYIKHGNHSIPLTINCSLCYAWTIAPQGQRMNLVYKSPIVPPSSLPVDCGVAGLLNVAPGYLSSELLKTGYCLARDKFASLEWSTIEKVKSVLSLLCFSDRIKKELVTKVANHRAWSAYQADRNSLNSDTERQFLDEQHRDHPELFNFPEPPSLLSIFELDQMPEAPMHIIMGIVKAVTTLLHDWAVKVGKGSALVSIFNHCISMMHSFLRIQYYPVSRYGKDGTYPGWVGDTCRTWWIILPWVVEFLPSTMDSCNYSPPTTELANWTEDECITYLRMIGWTAQTIKNLKPKEVTKAVKEARKKRKQDPYIDLPSRDEIVQLSFSMHHVFRLLMADVHTKSSLNLTHSWIKDFLSRYERVFRLVHPKVTPGWISKYNFLGLLRAHSNLSTFGSLRVVQEGGDEGEGLVKDLRDLTSKGPKENSASQLIRKFFNKEVLDGLCEELPGASVFPTIGLLDGEEDDTEMVKLPGASASDSTEAGGLEDATPLEYDMGEGCQNEVWVAANDLGRYRSYRSVDSARLLVRNHLPISAVGLAGMDGVYYCVRRRGSLPDYFPILITKSQVISRLNGFEYHTIDVTSSEGAIVGAEETILPCKYFLLLPFPRESGDSPRPLYTILGGELEAITFSTGTSKNS
jgi:hypothetical protein